MLLNTLPNSRCKRSRSRSTSPTSSRRSTSLFGALSGQRAMSEWQLLHERSVMALPPSTEMVRSRLLKTSGELMTVKVAAFDMDDTLLVYSRSQKAVAESNKLLWRYQNVPSYMRHLNSMGFLVVVVSNQSGIAKSTGWDAHKAETVQKKIVTMSQELDVPLVALVATRNDRWRKPQPALWALLQDFIERGAGPLPAGAAPLDCTTHSFYVGDAAGRPATAGTKKDFSCSDRRFARNLGLPFLVPEQFFGPPLSELWEDPRAGVGSVLRADYIRQVQSTPTEFSWGGVHPLDLQCMPTSYESLQVQCITAAGTSPMTTPASPPFFATPAGTSQELVLLVGYPSCGKSTFYKRHFLPYGYVHVSRDALGTKERCAKLLEQSWLAGKSVVVDNTNPTPADRKVFIDIVRKLHKGPASSLPVRAIVLACTKQMAQHLNVMRARLGLGTRIPDVAYHVFGSKYVSLTPASVKTEGLTSVTEVPPVAYFDDLPPPVRREFFVLS